MKVWDSVRISTDRLMPSDAILVAQYCALSVAFDKSRNVVEKTKLGGLLLQYARALRLTPHSRYDARAGARAADHALAFSAADDDRLLAGALKQ